MAARLIDFDFLTNFFITTGRYDGDGDWKIAYHVAHKVYAGGEWLSRITNSELFDPSNNPF